MTIAIRLSETSVTRAAGGIHVCYDKGQQGGTAAIIGETCYRLGTRRGGKAVERQHPMLGNARLRDTLLFPDLKPSEEAFREQCVRPAVELRQRVRDLLEHAASRRA